MPSVRQSAKNRWEYDRLLTVVLTLVVMGAIWVFSASSSIQILQDGGNGTALLIKYVTFGCFGFCLLAVLSRVGVGVVRSLALPMLVISVVLCIMAALPGVGLHVNGARRWLGFSSLSMQPSELAKFSIIAFLALAVARRQRPMQTFRDVVPYLAVITLLVLVIGGLQEDLGTAIVITCSCVVVLIIGGMPVRLLWPMAGLGLAGIAALVAVAPYRMARLTSFTSPWADAANTGYQATQGQMAIGSGGFFGVGLGQGVAKAEWLPEAPTDFILAVVGEELGAIGVIILLILYGAIAYLGFRVADRAANLHQRLLATGVTSVIVIQALLNVFVVLGLFPLTGVPLPFISYGSTNLTVLLCGIGILLNISRTLVEPGASMVEYEASEPDPDPRPRSRKTKPRNQAPARGAGPARGTGRPTPRLRPAPVMARTSRAEKPSTRPVKRVSRRPTRAGRAQAYSLNGNPIASWFEDEPQARPARASRSAGESGDIRDRSGRHSGARGASDSRSRRAAS